MTPFIYLFMCTHSHAAFCFVIILAETYPKTTCRMFQRPLSGNIETSQTCKYNENYRTFFDIFFYYYSNLKLVTDRYAFTYWAFSLRLNEIILRFIKNISS